MPISFQCPSCGKVFKVGEDLAGKRAKCKCGQVLQIPARAQAAPAQSPPAQPTPAQQPADSSFGDWLEEQLQEPAPQAWEYGVKSPEPAKSRPPAPRPTAPIYVPERRTTTTSSSDDEGGGLMGIIIFILIFGVGNLILYKTTGWVIIPIPRK